MTLNYTSDTTVCSVENGIGAICIIGFCLDSHAKINQRDFTKYLLEESNAVLENLIFLLRRAVGAYLAKLCGVMDKPT